MLPSSALPPAAGAQLRQYYLAGTTSGSIESTTSPPINGAALAATMPGGGLAAAFTTELPEGSSPDGVPLIFAAGAVYSDGYIRCAPWLAGRHAAYLAGGQLVKQRSPPGGSVPLPSSCPLAAALPCRCRQHSTYGSGTLDLSTAALSDTETDKKAISALVAVSRRPLAFQLGAGMPAAAGPCILPWRSVLTAVRHRCIAIMSTCPSLHCTRPPSLPPFPPCPSGVVQTHLWLLIIGWGVLVPVGIVIARCFKELDPLWFKLHRCDALTPAGLACHS